MRGEDTKDVACARAGAIWRARWVGANGGGPRGDDGSTVGGVTDPGGARSEFYSEGRTRMKLRSIP